MKHKTIVKRLLALTLSCGMLAATLTGCGNSNGNKESEPAASQTTSSSVEEKVESKEEQSSEVVEEKFDPRTITEGVKLTIAIPTDAKVLNFNDNQQTKLIEEALGVELEFIEIPKADYSAKLELMVMGGDELPDILFNVGSTSKYAHWIEEGALVELSEYYDNPDYSVNIRKGIERSGVDTIMQMTLPSGEKYALPRFVYSPFSAVPANIQVYKPWLDELGLDVPTTLDQFYEACKKVVENDMNGNGKKDEIGVLGSAGLNTWFKNLMGSFVYAYDADYLVVEDGQLSLAYTSDEWKEGLKYIRKFVEEGLVPKEAFTQSSDQAKALFEAEETVVFSKTEAFSTSNLNIANNYATIYALEGPDGLQVTKYAPAMADAGAVITTDCENPLAAFLVCDYMCSEEMSISNRYGLQGTDWDYWDEVKSTVNENEFAPRFTGFDYVFYAYDIIEFWSSSDPHDHCYRQKGPMMLDQTLTGGIAMWLEAEDEAIRLNATTETTRAEGASHAYANYLPDEIVDYAPLTVEEAADIADIKATLTSYVEEMTNAFLTGTKDIDTEWSGFQAELEKIGYKDYLDVMQVAYDRVH